MYSKVLVVLACAALACANDILQGSNTEGLEPFFEGFFEATWSFSRATKDVFINSSGLITAINVTDLRDGKDGEASIASGGIGHPNVTITLKSPAALRGYDFKIQVYADDEKQRDIRGEPSTPATVIPADKPTEKPNVTEPKPKVTEPELSTAKTTTTTDVTSTTTDKPKATSDEFPTVTYPTVKPKLVDMELPEEIDVPMKTKINFEPPHQQF